jgi:hypothetical protein
MVGGKIVEVNDCGELLEVVCADRTYPKERCAVKIKKGKHWKALRPGDSFWWQGSRAMWTPQENAVSDKPGQVCGKDYDIVFRRVGYSYTPEV